MIFKHIFFLIMALFLSSCSSIGLLHRPKKPICSIEHIPQNVSIYSDIVDKNTSISKKDFIEKYLTPWSMTSSPYSTNSITWPFSSYKEGNVYGANLQLIDKSFFARMYRNCNIDDFLSISRRAITIKLSNLRSFPTKQPIFLNPKRAGEGFPFDYAQTSLIEANKPLFVSHFSLDKEWLFVYSSFTYGWIKADRVAFVDKHYINIFKKSKKVFIFKEGIPIYDNHQNFLYKSRLGMLFALKGEDSKNYIVYIIKKSLGEQNGILTTAKIQKDTAHIGFLNFNKQNINLIIKEVSKTFYGWGGLYAQRDCSATIRDIFVPFGIWLPRNSSKQARVGNVIKIKGLSDDDKIKIIKENAKPFRTLIHKNGHIMLYVGIYKNNIVVFQNLWGLKTEINGKFGRMVIGKPIFSTLYIGKNQKDVDDKSLLIHKINSINNL